MFPPTYFIKQYYNTSTRITTRYPGTRWLPSTQVCHILHARYKIRMHLPHAYNCVQLFIAFVIMDYDNVRSLNKKLFTFSIVFPYFELLNYRKFSVQ